MSALDQRLAELSPEKRALFELLLAGTAAAGPAGAPHEPAPAAGPWRRRWCSSDAPLSHGQRRLWFLDRLEPGSSAYNMTSAFRLGGGVDLACLRGALAEVVRRHEVLRTVFPILPSGEPVQRVIAAAPVAMPLADLRGLPAAAKEAAARRLALDEAARPFDLARGPLLRVVVAALGGADHLVLINLHHIAGDGWSVEIFERELMTLYDAARHGRRSPLPELPLQYRDFAAWQQEQLAGGLLQHQLAWWRRQLAGAPPRLELPADLRRERRGPAPAAAASFEIEAGVAAALQRLAHDEGTTLFAVLLAAFHVLLARHSRQADTMVGSFAAGRGHLETEELIGFFVNTLVLRLELRPAESCRALAGRAREMVLGAQAHQDLPFEKLVKDLRPERGLDRSPFFQVTFRFENRAEAAARLPGIRLQPVAVQPAVAQFDISAVVRELDSGLRLTLVYARHLFSRPLIARLGSHYLRLLAGIAAQPDAPVAELPLLSPAERHHLLREWGGAGAAAGTAADLATLPPAPGESLAEIFTAQARRTPGAVAVSCEGRRITYGELDRRSNQLAHRLRRLGVGPEERVGLCVERSLELVVGLLGIVKAGGAYVPLDPAYPRERLELIAEDSRARVMVATGRTRAGLPAAAAVVLLDGAAGDLDGQPAGDLPPCLDAGNLAYVIYTSGSTGRPKGVLVTHGNVIRLLRATWPWFRFGERDVWTLFHSCAFDFSVWEIWGALLYGGRLVVVPYLSSRAPERLLALLAAERVTVLNQTPSAFAQLMRAAAEPGRDAALADLRLVIFGGEALEPAHLAPWFERRGDRHPELVNMYGITETTVHVTYRPMRAADALAGRRSVIGRPIPDLRVRVLEPSFQPAPLGVTGEIAVGGAGLARGYLGLPELTAERFVPDPLSGEPGARLYRSGDLGRLQADGELEYLGRLDRQVKIRGFRIELGEIEAALERQPGVARAVVMARGEDGAPGGGRRLAAYYLAGPPGEAPPSPAELRERLRRELPEHMIPAWLVPLERLPLTAHGKVDLRSLPAPETALAGAAGAAPKVLPRDEVERALLQAWEEVLERQPIGVTEDFFDLGGHSLLAVRLQSRLRERFGREVPLASFFSGGTVERQAALLRTGAAAAAAPALLALPRRRGLESRLPMSFAQQRLWFLDRLQPGRAAYNIPLAWQLSGDLDHAALAAALSAIVLRHEVLRTRLIELDGEPLQVVAPAAEVPLPLCDLAALGPAPRQRELIRLVAADAVRPFDLAREMPWRAALLRLEAGEHALLLSLHHAAADGWSVAILARELGALYEAARRRQPAGLEPLAVQYADFAAWQRSWLAGEVLAQEVEWWRRRLAGLPAVLQLPYDRPRPAAQSYRGAVEPGILPAELLQGLKELGRRQGATLFMTLLAGFAVLLARHAGQWDLVVGTPVAGRTRRELEPLIGLFVNTLALPLRLRPRSSFAALLGEVRELALAAQAHQELPFEKLIEELQPARSQAHEPLFQVLFNLQNTPGLGPGLAGVESRPLSAPATSAKFDLSLYAEERGEVLAAGVEYAVDLFDRTTVWHLLRRLERLLAGAVAEPELTLDELPLLAGAERHQLLAEWNDAASAAPARASEEIARWARCQPGAVAVAADGERLTYGELAARSGRLAGRLRRLGVGQESAVGICMGRSPSLVVALLAVWRAGGAYVPMDPSYPVERLAFMLEDAGARVLLTDAETPPAIRRAAAVELRVDAVDWTAGEAADDDEITAGAGAQRQPATAAAAGGGLAFVIYTSGSTGRPKGVEVTHLGLRNVFAAMLARPGLARHDVVLAVASLSFDIAALEIFLPLLVGARVELASRETAADPARLQARIAAARATVLQATPATWRMLVDSGWQGHPGLRLLSGGEALSEGLAAELGARSPEVWNLYGPTETTIYSSRWRVTAGAVSLGRPLDNTRLVVLDDRLAPVPAGIAGELWIGGLGVARGYRSRPALTAERFLPDPFAAEPGARLYRSGDLVRQRGDGTLEYLGRIDHQVKIRGFRVELGEIEAALESHPAVGRAVVMARGPAGEQQLVAYYEARPAPDGPPASAAELRESLRRRLPDYMVPARLVALDHLPLTPNGKVDRRSLPEPEAGNETAAGAPPRVPARDALELALVGLWETALRREPIGITEDFFALGGHSLLAVRLLARIRERFGSELPLSSLFGHGTVERQAALLRDAAGSPAPAAVRAAAPRDGSGELAVAILPDGEGEPLVLIHPVGGSILSYQRLAASLRAAGCARPVWALQPPAASAPPLLAVEALADRYLEELRQLRPAGGPQHLAGWSMGALVAYEMARRLRHAGQPAALLALLDPPAAGPPSAAAAESTDLDLLATFAADLLGLAGLGAAAGDAWAELRAAAPGDASFEAAFALLFQHAVQRGVLPAEIDLATLRGRFEIFRRNATAASTYRPGRYDGRLDLLLAAPPDAAAGEAAARARGWARLNAGETRVHSLPGGHYGLLQPEHATVWAQRLAAALAAPPAALAAQTAWGAEGPPR